MSSLDRYLADREEHEITEQRDITLESNPTVDDICRRYEGWLKEVSEAPRYPEKYANGLKHLKGLEYTAQDVREFSIRLKQYEDEEDFRHTGLFISVLVNTCPDEEFNIVTEHLEMPIDCIGYENTKQVTVSGDAGDWVGFGMGGGSITVSGDAGEVVGYRIEGGSITVNGNAGVWGGSFMKGGSITVNGNAGEDVGRWMEGGSVRIEGEIESISGLWEGGEIYHKGKLVRPLWKAIISKIFGGLYELQ